MKATSLELSIVVIIVLMQGCAQQGTFTNTADNDAYLAESVVSSLNFGLSDAERASSLTVGSTSSKGSGTVTKADQKPKTFFAKLKERVGFRSLASVRVLPACTASRFSPKLGSTSCSASPDGVTVTSNYNCSIFQSQDQLLSGTVTSTFDSASTCTSWLSAIPSTGNFKSTTTNFVRTTLDGSIITTFTDSSPNYNDSAIGGGVSVGFGPNTRNISILGLKKTRLNPSHQTLFEHSVHTTSALTVTGSLATADRAIASGNVIVDHNTKKFTANGVINNLRWSQNCCLPVTGTITFTLSGSRTGQAIVDFNTGTCGEVFLSGSAELAVTASPGPSANPTPSPSGSSKVVTENIGGCE